MTNFSQILFAIFIFSLNMMNPLFKYLCKYSQIQEESQVILFKCAEISVSLKLKQKKHLKVAHGVKKVGDLFAYNISPWKILFTVPV